MDRASSNDAEEDYPPLVGTIKFIHSSTSKTPEPSGQSRLRDITRLLIPSTSSDLPIIHTDNESPFRMIVDETGDAGFGFEKADSEVYSGEDDIVGFDEYESENNNEEEESSRSGTSHLRDYYMEADEHTYQSPPNTKSSKCENEGNFMQTMKTLIAAAPSTARQVPRNASDEPTPSTSELNDESETTSSSKSVNQPGIDGHEYNLSSRAKELLERAKQDKAKQSAQSNDNMSREKAFTNPEHDKIFDTTKKGGKRKSSSKQFECNSAFDQQRAPTCSSSEKMYVPSEAGPTKLNMEATTKLRPSKEEFSHCLTNEPPNSRTELKNDQTDKLRPSRYEPKEKPQSSVYKPNVHAKPGKYCENPTYATSDKSQSLRYDQNMANGYTQMNKSESINERNARTTSVSFYNTRLPRTNLPPNGYSQAVTSNPRPPHPVQSQHNELANPSSINSQKSSISSRQPSQSDTSEKTATAVNVETTSANIETVSANEETASANEETASANEETASANVETASANIDTASANVEAKESQSNVTTGVQNSERKRYVDEEAFQEMNEKYRRFFGNKNLYEPELRPDTLSRLLNWIMRIESDDNRLRHQFLLRLARTKLLEMDGPIVGTLKNLISGEWKLNTDEVDSTLIQTMQLVEEFLIRIPHFRNTIIYAATVSDLVEKIPGIEQSASNTFLTELRNRLRDPNYLSTRILNRVADWPSDLSFANEPLVPAVQTLLEQRLNRRINNIVQGPYPGSAHYLETWFKLMQEDFLGSFRTAVKDFRRDVRSDDQFPKGVRLSGGYYFTFTKIVRTEKFKGQTLHLLEFSLEGLEHIDWSVTDRLRPDSFIAFSKDHFKTAHYGITPQDDKVPCPRENNTVWVKMLPKQDGALPLVNHFHGIQARDMYEPYRCVLERIQQIARRMENGSLSSLPMERYIVQCNNSISYPQYLEEHATLKLRSGCFIDVRTVESFPGLQLDTSQTKALKLALTHELSLIQGPPGTGKSYIGAQVVDILMNNRNVWQTYDRGCIMLVAYTNHAIDQFVVECEKLGMDMSSTLRIGGRAGEEMEKFLLRNKRRELWNYFEYKDLLISSRKNRDELERTREQLNAAVQLAKSKRREMPFEQYALFISSRHRNQLERVYGSELNQDMIKKWLVTDTGIFNSSTDPSNTNQLGNVLTMSDIEAKKVINLFKLNPNQRLRLYVYWCESTRDEANKLITEIKPFEDKLQQKYEAYRTKQDEAVVQRSTIMALTTSGACRNSHLVETVKPTIVIVEEAAEVLESHIFAPLTTGCQHLILIGDHQQLRPRVAEFQLEKRNMAVSLLERLSNNDLPMCRLDVQHRMHPEIADILVPHIYPSLNHHERVYEYPEISGVRKRNVYLFHNNPEDKVGEKTSRKNEFEAEFLYRLCKYLLQQDVYTKDDITILTTYLGQMRVLKNKIEEDDFTAGVAVKTVDNFQGEENKIILLSFVRSNEINSIGFLKWANRICVALSRAKHGFYALGDFWLYARNPKSTLWRELCDQLVEKDDPNLCPTLEIKCQIHGTVQDVVDGADFTSLAPEGGCTKPCTSRLDCGHTCTRLCHPADPQHQTYTCEKDCRAILDCSHMCTKICCDLSDNNIFSIAERFTGEYRHCLQCDKFIDCCEEVEIIPEECGHTGYVNCSDVCNYKCEEKVEKTPKNCKHIKTVACHVKPKDMVCRTKVDDIVPGCGHPITRECYKSKIPPCNTIVSVPLPTCEHEVQCECHRRDNPPLCMTKVESNTYCKRCGNIPTVACHRKYDEIECTKPREITMDCRHDHKKIVLCCEYESQKHEHCYEKVRIKMDSCEHEKWVNCLDEERKDGMRCNVKVTTKLSCKHSVQHECSEKNPKCTQKIDMVKLEQCGHFLKDVKCGEVEDRKLDPCDRLVPVAKRCGHTVKVTCFNSVSQGKIDEGRPRCRRWCKLVCAHDKKCERRCEDDCLMCPLPCPNKCLHGHCKRKCYEECDRKPCAERCTRKLKCGHDCPGLCGELCPSSHRCWECFPANLNLKERPRIRILPCGHDLPVYGEDGLDAYMKIEEDDNVQVLVPRYCPSGSCGILISYVPRYVNYIKRCLQLIKRKDYSTNRKWLYCKRGKHIMSIDKDGKLSEAHKHTCPKRNVVEEAVANDTHYIADENSDEDLSDDDNENRDMEEKLDDAMKQWSVEPSAALSNNRLFRALTQEQFLSKNKRRNNRNTDRDNMEEEDRFGGNPGGGRERGRGNGGPGRRDQRGGNARGGRNAAGGNQRRGGDNHIERRGGDRQGQNFGGEVRLN